jgi:hypothetical protein
VPINANVPAHGEHTVDVAWPKKLATNKVADATVTIHHGDDNAQWSGTVDPKGTPHPQAKTATNKSASASPASGGGLGVPLWVIGAIAIAVAWLGYELFAANRGRGVVTPLAAIPSMPLVDGGATARLHDELEPLVAAITALAESMQPRGAPERAPSTIEQLDAYDEIDAIQELHESPVIDTTVPLDDVAWVDDVEPDAYPPDAAFVTVDHGEPEVIDDPVATVPALGIDGGLALASATAVDESAEPGAAEAVADAVATLQELQELRPWEPQLVVEQIRSVLDQILPDNASTTVVLDGPEAIAVLTPDELVDAVASALTVAPTTVRHWLSDETIDAATRTTVVPHDIERIVRERQVLAAQVEVLKRALSDLG